MARAFNVEATRNTFELPDLTRHQIKALMSNLDQDARSIIIIAINELWQHECGTPERDLVADVDRILKHLGLD